MPANTMPVEDTCECAYCQTIKPVSAFSPSWLKDSTKSKKCKACVSVDNKLRTKWQLVKVTDYGTFAYYQRAYRFYTELNDLTNGFTRIPKDVELYASMAPTEFERSKGKIITSTKFTATPEPTKPPSKASVTFEKFNVKVTLEGLTDTVARLMNDICNIK